MGFMTVSGSASRTSLVLGARFSSHSSRLRRPFILAFKTDKSKNAAFVAPEEPIAIPIDIIKEPQKRSTRTSKISKRLKAISTDEAPPCNMDLDYNDIAATLENIYKLSPADISDLDESDQALRIHPRTRKRTKECNEKAIIDMANVVRNQRRRMKRLTLDNRVALKRKEKEVSDLNKEEGKGGDASGDVEVLLRDYSLSTDLVSLGWRKMKIPAVLPYSEHTWLFNLMHPMKGIVEVKENLHIDLGREPTDAELASAVNMNVPVMRRHIEVGQAARNKLIMHNLRLVLFVINKYYQEMANSHKFQDLCQAGAKGLITAIERFEPMRGFRLSTYGLFWIRHAILRSMTVASFARVPFGIESVRQKIQRSKLELTCDLNRLPTEKEIIERVGISLDRYHDVLKASEPVFSLHKRHVITQEEFIKGIADIDGVGGDKRRQSAHLRLALDDVLDSLKPKESLVIRQRYGLDGKGDRTLGEIAGNLNISREMVRKYEVKALMKLKHPARVEYLCRYIF